MPPTKSMVKTMAARVRAVPKSVSMPISPMKSPATSMWGRKPMAKCFIFSCLWVKE